MRALDVKIEAVRSMAAMLTLAAQARTLSGLPPLTLAEKANAVCRCFAVLQPEAQAAKPVLAA